MKRSRKKSILESTTTPALTPLEGARAYAKLRQDVERAHLLDRQYGYYGVLITVLILGFSIGVIGLIFSTSLLAVLIFAIIIGFFTVQFGGLMHDAGHRAIFNAPWLNDIVGQIAAAPSVLSYENWRISHNLHHAHTNEAGVDPDLDIPFHAFTNEQVKRLPAWVRPLTPYQVYLFYPLRALVFLSTRLDGFLYFRRNAKFTDLPAIIVFGSGVFLWFVGPWLFFPLPKAILSFVVMNLVVGFYASNIFAPNHKAMPQVKKGVKFSFFEQQIITSRNVAPSLFGDFIYMGLNYQIEHHLFPNCPRPNIRKLSRFVKRACKEYGLPYTVDTTLATHKEIIASLRETANAIQSSS